MKKYLFFLCIMMIMVSSVQARNLKILRLNTKTIKIGKNTCKEGDVFPEGAIIHWSSPKQVMWVKYIDGRTREKRYLSLEAFGKRKVKTPKDYFNKINHPSTRSYGSDDIEFVEGKNKSHFNGEKRIALIIGNSNYNDSSGLSTLSNPINDAVDVAETLVYLGFDVCVLPDVIFDDFELAIRKFCSHIEREQYNSSVFYYCGHGIQNNNRQFLVPIDSQLDFADGIYRCIDLDDVCSRIGRTGCKTNLIFIDACRIEKEWNKNEQYLWDKSPDNIGILFSTAPNSKALDGDGRNSTFAKGFIQSVMQPLKSCSYAMSEISMIVQKETHGQQVPEPRGNIGFDGFSFVYPDGFQRNDSTRYYAELYEKGKKLYDSEEYEAAIPYIEKAAEGENLDAIKKLIDFYKNNNSLSKAEIYARRGVELGDVYCGYLLGSILYEMDRKVDALDWFIKTAELGNPDAAFNAGLMYKDGDGTTADYEKAVYLLRQGMLMKKSTDWLKMNEKSSNKSSSNKLSSRFSDIFLKRLNTPEKKAEKALDEMKASWYENYIDLVYDRIKLIPVDADPIELYNTYCFFDFRRSTRLYGILLPYTLFFSKDDDPQKYAYLIASAERGYPKAQMEYGELLVSSTAKRLGIYNESASGEWCERALKAYLKLAEDGNEEALEELGRVYKEGRYGFEVNLPLAEKYFKMGADLGNKECQSELGELLYERCRKDEALIWLIKSAEQGNSKAAYLLGQMYELGDGIPMDIEKAITWYIASGMQTTNEDSKKALEALDRITKEFIKR